MLQITKRYGKEAEKGKGNGNGNGNGKRGEERESAESLIMCPAGTVQERDCLKKLVVAEQNC